MSGSELSFSLQLRGRLSEQIFLNWFCSYWFLVVWGRDFLSSYDVITTEILLRPHAGYLTFCVCAAEGVGTLGAQHSCLLPALVTEVPRAHPFTAELLLNLKALQMVALSTAQLVAHHQLASISTDEAIVFVNWNKKPTNLSNGLVVVE